MKNSIERSQQDRTQQESTNHQNQYYKEVF